MKSLFAKFHQLQSASPAQVVLFAGALGLLILLCVYPFALLISKIFLSDGAGLALVSKTFSSSTVWNAAGFTLVVSISVAMLSFAIGFPLAWILSRTDFPHANRVRSWMCLPYAIPPYIGAIAWIFLANPTTGLLNQIVGKSWINIYSLGGLIWVEASFMYTFLLLTVLSALDRMDSSFEEAARLSGAGPLRVVLDITIPLIKPSIMSGIILTFLATAASFGVPALIGNPARIYLLTTQIYMFQKMGSDAGLYQAGIVSMLLLVWSMVVLFVNASLTRNQQFQTVSGKTSRQSVVTLNKWKPLVVLFVLLIFILVFVLPVGGVLLSSLSRVQGLMALENFTLDNFTRTLFQVSETPRAIANSLLSGVVAATIASALGLILAYIITKTKVPGRQLIDVLASIPYSTPGTVVALALILVAFGGGFFGLGRILYDSLGILILAYVIKYLSFAIKTTADGFRQVDNVLAEAARVSGAGWFTALSTIWIPLMKPAIVAAWFLVFMPVVSELTMTLLLSGSGTETIGTLIFQLQEYADASGGGASVLAVMVVVFVILINLLVKKVSRGKYGL